ncbi:MAG: protein kinase domain-containing protein [Planctomycetota bacterium]
MKLGPYDLGAPIGEGGMGIVYRARHAVTGAAVALKAAHAAAATPEQRARFRREAEIGARLDHPGIVRVLDYDADADPPWLAMPLIAGESLGGWARRTRPDWRAAVSVARDVAHAVQAAHDAGVVHRDLKPGNVLIDAQGRTYVTDFGLAKESSASTKLTATGDALGTPAYMSPEQARGDLAQLGPATDVWSLGALCFELCAHRPPFTGDSHAAILAAVIHGPLPDAGTCDAPAEFARLLAGCLDRDPRGRYPSAGAFAADCERLLAGEPLHWRSQRRRQSRSGLALAGAALALAGVVALPLNWRATRSRAAAKRASAGWALRHDAPDRARTMLEAAAAVHPGLHAAQLHRGLLRWGAGEFDAALAAWRAIPEGVPERAEADLCTALVAFFHFRPRAERDAAYARLPQDESLAGRLGRAIRAVEAKRWAEARTALAGVAGWEADLLRGYIESLAPDGDPAKAARAYDAAFTFGVKPIWAVYNRANARTESGDLEGALDDYASVIRSRPLVAMFRRSRALARQRAGDLDAARADMDLAVTLAPGDWQMWDVRSRVRAAQGDPAGALADNREACRLAPGVPELLLDRALLHEQLQDLPGALDAMDAAITARPKSGRYRARRALMRIRAGRLDRALADATRAIELEPALAFAWHARARVHRAAGREPAALADLQQAARLTPDRGAQIRLDLGLSLDRLGRPEAAIAAYRDALARRPAFPEALGNLGLLLERSGRPREALPLLDRFLAEYPNHRAAPMVAKARAKAAAAGR